MINNESHREIGYSCDIAFEQLLRLYASCSEFKHDCHYINTKPEVIQYRRQQFKKGRRGDPVVLGLIKNRNNFLRITKEWRHNRRGLLKVIPDDVRIEAEKIAEKWGLRCNWGPGLIYSLEPHFYSFNFMLSPGPPNSIAHLTTEISIDDTDDSIKKKSLDIKKRFKTFKKITQGNLKAVDYRGFEKRATKDSISTQTQWLFWHITDPYLSAREISMIHDRDEFYIQRCYQLVAKLLGIKLVPGWTKGRKKPKHETRAEMRRSLIEAKTSQKIAF
ncbi:hypothetical protein ACFLWX_02685 [Chloroflexota bacterium]